MESDLSQRLDRLVQVVVNRYLPALISVMGQHEVDPSRQRDRVDQFVRALVDWKFGDRLTSDGRPVPVQIEHTNGEDGPPTLVFNKGLLDQVSDEEMRQALRQPVESLLGLPAMSVGLVLSIDDFEKLKRLATTAGSTTVRLADVPAVIERRLKVFAARLNRLVSRLGGSRKVVRRGLGPLRSHLIEKADAWPSWEDLRDVPGVSDVINNVDEGLPDDYTGPDSAALVELFWESLELSTTSFLRHAATNARADTSTPDGLGRLLREIGRTLQDEGAEVPSTAREWPAFEPVFQAWNELFRSEQRILAWTTEGRATPDIHLFEPPRRSMRLAEPENLPWDYPLITWSVRERDALRDLLDGTRESMLARIDTGLPDRIEDSPWEIEADPFDVGAESTATFTTRLVEAPRRSEGGGDLVPSDVQRRALGACWQWMERKFRVLNVAEQRQLLETLRAGYDGFFGGSSLIWSRRFQSCDAIDPVEAFKVLAGEIRFLLGPTMVFDGYSDIRDPHPDRVPNFVCVVGLPAGQRGVRFRLPLVALKSCWDEAPLIVRIVEVEGGRTEWLRDLEFTENSLLGEETASLIDSFEQDHVTMSLQRIN